MIEHQLYGVRVLSERALFPNPEKFGSEAPGSRDSVTLENQSFQAAGGSYSETVYLNTNHGREVFLRTDRPFAASMPGQVWCLEVDAVVSFTWISGSTRVSFTEGVDGSHRLTSFWFIHIFLPMYLTLE